MPALRSLRTAALLLLLAACGDDSTGPATVPGSMSATLDGTAWRGDANAELRDGTLVVYSTREGTEHHVIAEVRYSGPGVYALDAATAKYMVTLGGDVLVYLAKATGGTMEIDSYDRARRVVTGSLTITAEGTRGVTRFENGEFVAPVAASR